MTSTGCSATQSGTHPGQALKGPVVCPPPGHAPVLLGWRGVRARLIAYRCLPFGASSAFPGWISIRKSRSCTVWGPANSMQPHSALSSAGTWAVWDLGPTPPCPLCDRA